MSGQKIETGHQDVVHDVAMDYYGKRLATASSDNTIKKIGVSKSTSQHLATLAGHQGPVWQAAWAHPKFGSLLASCSYDGKVIIWKEGADPQMETSRSSLQDLMVDGINLELNRLIQLVSPLSPGPLNSSCRFWSTECCSEVSIWWLR